MSQYTQLMLFYDQLNNMADEIHDLINREMFDEILSKLTLHDKVILQIKLTKKCTKFSEKEQEEIAKIEEQLRIKEKDNIELLRANMTAVKKELNSLKLKSKLHKAYGQIPENQHQGSIIDIDDSYRGNSK